jgi:hypothetical protein
MKRILSVASLFGLVALIAFLSFDALVNTATAVHADVWWLEREAPTPTAVFAPAPDKPQVDMIAPLISPLQSPLEVLLQPEFCEKRGLTGEKCRKEWLTYLANLPPWKKP